MTWANLLFLHWRLPPEAVRPLVPPELELDTFDGSAWVALVPFRMQACSFRGFGWAPGALGLRDFYECNVRTYARFRGLAGVWFFSLDAQTLLPVLGGRWMWSLNYVHSRFDVTRDGDATRYQLTRRRGPWPAARTSIAWRPGARLPTSEPGSLNHFLTERYWLFTRRRGRIMAGRVEHDPWPLHQAELLHLDDGLVAAGGAKVSGPPMALASPSIDVMGWSLIAPQ